MENKIITEGRNHLEGLPPIVGRDCKVLILGTFPGEESLKQKEYYAHPRNLFWDIMDRVCGAGRDKDYDSRIAILRKVGVCLWDVLKSCTREGSLDARIRKDQFAVAVNDFYTFLSLYPFKAIFFNGKKAATLFHKYVIPTLKCCPPLFILPSTSPANARITKGQKLSRWRDIKKYL